MKIRKLYIALCGILFAAQSVSAQQNMMVVSNDGTVNAVDVSSVNYATFNTSDKWFTITNDGTPVRSTTSITADCTVKLSTDTDVKSITDTPEVGVCYSKDNTAPTVEDACISLGSKLESYTFTLKSLALGTDYYFKPYIKLSSAVFYGAVATAKTLDTNPVDNSKTINGHKFIDLCLPSGVLWAETNIGAETAADDGDYYAWGETEPQSSNSYSWSSYRFVETGSLTKYNSTDGIVALEKEDDVAYVKWGDFCRMPTDQEFAELRNSDNCIWTWTSQTTSSGSSIDGYKVTSTRNGNSIFLPASGYRYDGDLMYHGSNGLYWSNALYSIRKAFYQGFRNGYYNWEGYNSRYYGQTVRPVAKP